MLFDNDYLALTEAALQEDLGYPYCDLTTQTLFSKKKLEKAQAYIISKHTVPIVICGLSLLQNILSQLDSHAQVIFHVKEGAVIAPFTKIATLVAQPQTLMMAERVLLNFLQRLSAIATLTTQFMDKVKHTSLKILDTRKTTPGWRKLEKYAVFCGGGVNHRMGLYDAMMIKDTHIALLGGIEVTLQQLPEDLNQQYPVIVEVQSLAELQHVLQHGLHKISRILLDNMPVTLLSECVTVCQKRIPLEASGNINLSNIQAIAETGVEFASVGQLTHSAGWVDLSLKTEKSL